MKFVEDIFVIKFYTVRFDSGLIIYFLSVVIE